MMLDVAFTPLSLGPAEVAGRTVFVIDVLRATTTICAALANGARAVIPSATPEEAVKLAQSIGGDALLAGERDCVRMPGFALGNSPREMTREVVEGREIVQSTTNGTAALLAARRGRHVYAAAAVNLSMAAERLRQAVDAADPVLVLCAGRSGRFGLDDACTAGRLILAALGDGEALALAGDSVRASIALARAYGENWMAPFEDSAAGRALIDHGFRADLAEAARVDAFPVLPLFHDLRLTAAELAPA